MALQVKASVDMLYKLYQIQNYLNTCIFFILPVSSLPKYSFLSFTTRLARWLRDRLLHCVLRVRSPHGINMCTYGLQVVFLGLAVCDFTMFVNVKYRKGSQCAATHRMKKINVYLQTCPFPSYCTYFTEFLSFAIGKSLRTWPVYFLKQPHCYTKPNLNTTTRCCGNIIENQ